uniref:Uncharacterized protein n=1 Tax=Candidatus Kentrum sp. TC TaxID=2126339 RepID=A0A450Z8Y8_9GAMM|nr:MAG: hypothetical protein BECKTC1821E_GA0114239_10906 [Candidatus Kentron sp. TC]VFK50264.1 MAG: hypothetical protein BECKTC1821D_GA0114238_10977 [Candidatus Kentron sp. TC]VFK63227.1 MAG: hypothetical protein BECKTC1821F_GA0114240_10897 [Candidatus Kentron sp. TC]
MGLLLRISRKDANERMRIAAARLDTDSFPNTGLSFLFVIGDISL